MPVSSRRDFLRWSVAVLAWACWPTGARAEDRILLKRAELVARKESYVLLGGFDVQLGATLEDALQRGVTLTFVQLFEADRPRDFWFAEDLAVMRRAIKFSYNALLRQYQLNSGNTLQAYDTLSEAVDALGDFRDWPVLERKALNKKLIYRARVRMFLDTSQLPKPLQVNAVTSSRWDLDSGWQDWSFKP